jgi:hypothetical protein
MNVSPSKVRNIWLKEDMETWYKRLLRMEEEKNDWVVPFYESQGLQVEHILTDNGREYAGGR